MKKTKKPDNGIANLVGDDGSVLAFTRVECFRATERLALKDGVLYQAWFDIHNGAVQWRKVPDLKEVDDIDTSNVKD